MLKRVSQNQYLNFYKLFCACLIFPVILFAKENRLLHFLLLQFSGILVDI